MALDELIQLFPRDGIPIDRKQDSVGGACMAGQADGIPAKMPRWVYSVLPISLAAGPLGTLIQLHLVDINGPTLGIIYASLAVSAFNAVTIPAAIFWGYATDRIQSRRALVGLSYALMSMILLSLVFVSSNLGTIAVYSAFGFISVASATPLNLLIMETQPKSGWAGAFARLSMMSSVGTVVGLILSTVWAQELPVVLLSIPLGLFALASSGLAFVTIREPGLVLERETIIRREPSFFSRLLAIPLMFLNVPSISDFRRTFRGLRNELTSYVPLFYLSTVLFYLSSGLFNTSFVPAMSAFSMPAGEIFAVMLAGMFVQMVAFRYAGRYIEGRSLVSSATQGLLLRGGCYGLIGVSALLATGPFFAIPAFVLYPIASGIAFAVYYTSSNTMMFNTVQGRSQGSALGVYSAVVGFATLAGSIVSGFVSVAFGFHVTFIAAAAFLLLSAVVLARIQPEKTRTRGA